MITSDGDGVASTRSRPTGFSVACTVTVWPASTRTFCSNCLKPSSRTTTGCSPADTCFSCGTLPTAAPSMNTCASGTIDTIFKMPVSPAASALRSNFTICELPAATVTFFSPACMPGALTCTMCSPAFTSLMSTGTGPMSVPSMNARAPGCIREHAHDADAAVERRLELGANLGLLARGDLHGLLPRQRRRLADLDHVEALDHVLDHRRRVVGVLVAVDVDLGIGHVGVDDDDAVLRLRDLLQRRHHRLRVVLGRRVPVLERLVAVLLDPQLVAARGRRDHDRRLALDLAVEHHGRAGHAFRIGIRADVELRRIRLLDERHEQLLLFAQRRDHERASSRSRSPASR